MHFGVNAFTSLFQRFKSILTLVSTAKSVLTSQNGARHWDGLTLASGRFHSMSKQKPKRLHAPNNKPLPFKQRDLERCIRAARSMGIAIGKIEVDPHSGKIAITAGTSNENESTAQPNEWDGV